MSELKTIFAMCLFSIALVIAVLAVYEREDDIRFLIPIYWVCVAIYWFGSIV